MWRSKLLELQLKNGDCPLATLDGSYKLHENRMAPWPMSVDNLGTGGTIFPLFKCPVRDYVICLYTKLVTLHIATENG